MDRPFSLICDSYYKWILDQTNPYGAAELGLEHVPTNYWTPWGRSVNLAWYRDLALQTELKAEEDLIQVKPAKPIPASFHSYQNELDGVRKAVEGVAALRHNYINTEGYKALEGAELNCFENMRKGIDFADSTKLSTKDSMCRLPKKLYHRDVNTKVEQWRGAAVSCLTRHSVEHGDGNRKSFEECLENYGQELIHNGTNRDNLNDWAQRYVKLFEPGAIKMTQRT
jgi:hypothetical protein